jgi:conjugal transfer pilus assembly protein TraV
MRIGLLSLAPLLGLAACTTGGNVKGDFQCAAPGGTCAPMGSIDAAALASMGSGRPSPMSGFGIDTPHAPRTLSSQVIADTSGPQRTSDRVLRVVFPAHIDRDGIYREESAAHAVVEGSEWAQALGAHVADPRKRAALRPSRVEPVAVPTRALATLDEIIAARAVRASAISLPLDPATSPDAATAAASLPATPLPAAAPSGSAPVPAPVTALRSPIVMPFEGFASRASQPQSLAEAAAGLTAPRVAMLDPRDPAANYDTPDLVVARADPAPDQPFIKSGRSPERRDVRSASMPSTAATPSASPYGSRSVRWKGKSYEVPYRNRQPAALTAAIIDTPAPNRTAELNKAALARTTSPPEPASAAEQGEGLAPSTAASALSAAAAPLATRDTSAVPGGLSLRLPTSAAGTTSDGTPQ